MSGPRTVMATRSNSSTIDRIRRTKAIEMPPFCNPSRNGISSSPTPGRRSSGRTVSAFSCSKAALRASSSSRMVAVILAASFVSSNSLITPLSSLFQIPAIVVDVGNAGTLIVCQNGYVGQKRNEWISKFKHLYENELRSGRGNAILSYGFTS